MARRSRVPALAALFVTLLAITVAALTLGAGTGPDRPIRTWPQGGATAAVEAATASALEQEAPLPGVPASRTFCAVELSAGDGSPQAPGGAVVRGYGWATCQQFAPAPSGQLRGGTQSSEPIRVLFHRDGAAPTVDELAKAAPGLSYEDDMRELFPGAARRHVDRVSAARLDARIDRLLCRNLASARERLRRPGAELVGQGERCPR